MTITIWHNPRCSKSRAMLALLRERGFEPEIILYLETPPDAVRLAMLHAAAGIASEQGLRLSEPGAATLRGRPDAEILATMAADPILIERPWVETPKGARLCRPPERVLEIL